MSSTSSRASPLLPVLSFAGLSSFATGTATIGIFFVTDQAYRFSAQENFALGLAIGVTYTLGALAAGRIRRASMRVGLSARGFLAVLVLGLGALVLLPLAARSGAALFLLLALYAPLTGVFWPLVEHYVSGARRGARLRSAVGRFNVVWSLALVPSFSLVSPLLQRHAASAVFLCIALVHLASLPFLIGFRPEPGEPAPEDAHPSPREYAELLRVHRVLHATGYLVMYALSPYLPVLLGERLGLAPGTRSIAGATWLLARVLGFALLERWHGWHGRWSAAWGGVALLLGGFALTVLGPALGPAPLLCVLAGLFAFGLGLAALYTAALYYAFEVGGGEGGGSHEALIGLGYTIGPACGLAVAGLEHVQLVTVERREVTLLLLIAALSLTGVAWAVRHRRSRLESR